MATQEHVRILSDGVSEWNSWREENPNIQPDLRGANIEGEDLEGIDFSRTSLYSANLQGSKLTDADLKNAHFSCANLKNSNLSDVYARSTGFYDAKLHSADLSNSNLEGARFTKSRLVGTILENAFLKNSTFARARIEGADFFKSILDNTLFIDTKMYSPSRADSCVHNGDCVIDERTIKKSVGLSKKFLQRCGVSTEVIEHYKGKDGIVLKFTEEEFGQIIPFEWVLSRFIGDEYIIDKASEEIRVKLKSEKQIKKAMYAMIPSTLALMTQELDVVEYIKIQKEGDDDEVVTGSDLRKVYNLFEPEGGLSNREKIYVSFIEDITPVLGTTTATVLESILKDDRDAIGMDLSPRDVFSRVYTAFKKIGDGCRGMLSDVFVEPTQTPRLRSDTGDHESS